MSATRSPETDVRAEVLSAATRLFASHGFDGTVLQDIADAVGVTKPAVLHYYPSKEHIRAAVLDSILEHWNRTLPRLLVAVTASSDAATGSHDRFDAVFGELVRFFAADPDRARILLRETLDRPAEMRKLLRGTVHQWHTAVAGYIQAGRDTGRHYADVDPEAYVVLIMLLVITATASSPGTAAALDRDGPARFDREVARIAHASLFPPTVAHPPAPREPSAAPTTRTPKRKSAR